MLQELWSVFPILRQNINFSKIHFFYLFIIARLRLGQSHLREHKFKSIFQDTTNPLCNCRHDTASATRFFLYCSFYINNRCTPLGTIRSLDSKLSDYDLTQTLHFGNTWQTSRNNFKIINASIDYILSRKRFSKPLFKWILDQ